MLLELTEGDIDLATELVNEAMTIGDVLYPVLLVHDVLKQAEARRNGNT